MTLATACTPRVVIIGNGTLGPYSLNDASSVAIRFVSTSHVKLTRYAASTDDNNDGTLLVLNTDYTVGGTQDARTFTLIGSQAVLTSSQRIVAERVQSYTQDLDLTTGGAFNASSVESRFDKMAEFQQELKARLDRTVPLQFADATANVGFPSPPTSATQFLARNTSGEIVYATAADLDVDVALGTDWATILGLPAAGILDNLSGIRFVATYAALTALTTASGLSDNSIYCTYARATEEDGGFGFWRYDSASTATADSGTILAIDGGGAGRFSRLDAEVLDPRWFGVLVNTDTDNTAAMLLCIAAAKARTSGATILVNAGLTRFKQQLVVTVANNASLMFKGVGRQVSYWDFSSAANMGLAYHSTTVSGPIPMLGLVDFSIITSRLKAGTAVTAEWDTGTVTPTMLVENFTVGQNYYRVSEDNAARFGYWTNGIITTNAAMLVVDNYHFWSDIGPSYTEADWSQYALRCLGFGVSYKITNFLIQGVVTGIYIGGTIEGVYIDKGEIFAVRTGVKHDCAGEPGLHVSDVHVSASTACFHLINSLLPKISNCSAYVTRALESSAWPNWAGIINDGSVAKIGSFIGNTFITSNESHGAATSTGINMLDGDGFTIEGNQFYGAAVGDPLDVGIELASGVTHIDIGNKNIFMTTTTQVSGTGAAGVNIELDTQAATVVAGSGASGSPVTITFPKAFLAAPTVVCTHSGVGTVRAIKVTSVGTTTFDCQNDGVDAVDVAYIAYGRMGS